MGKENLRELNNRLRAAKTKKGEVVPTESEVNKLAEAIEKSKQPIINLPSNSRPVEYRLEVTKRNKNGAIESAKITPIFSKDS